MLRFLVYIFLISGTAYSQGLVFKNTNFIKLTNNTDTLFHALNGGLNAAQLSKIDLDFDGIEDICIFDRSSNTFSTYLVKNINGTTKHVYAPDYQYFFPDSLIGWVLLRDYNCDGKNDIFTHTNLGIRIYENITQTGGKPSFRLLVDGLKTQGFTFSNLQVAISDIPSISDIDGDGDLDILIFDWANGSFVEYNKNLSVETYGVCDSLKYEKISYCWGQFAENATCNDYSFGISCKGGSGTTTDSSQRIMHVGSTILATDLNNDQNIDLIIGDVSCYNLVKMLNVGSNDNAQFTSAEINYPVSNPANMLFPNAMREDIDNDGKADLLVSPNINFNSARDINFHESLWYYKDVSNNNIPDFSLIKRDLFQESGIDVGELSQPVFWDVDADGDEDLLVVSYGKRQNNKFQSFVYLYENLGNQTYQLIDTNYLDFASINKFGLRITKGDLNGDGALDMLYLTADNTGSFNPRLNIAYNQNSSAEPLRFDFTQAVNTNLSTQIGDSPFLYDIDNDNDLDLLIGSTAGRLRFFKNTGSSTNPIFTHITDTLGGIKNSSANRATAPFVTDIDSNGIADLLLADNSGTVKFYMNIGANMNSVFQVNNFLTIKNSVTNSFIQPKLGNYLYPYLTDLNNDNQPDLVLGTHGGGILTFQNITNDPNTIQKQEKKTLKTTIYPNPAQDLVTILSPEKGILELINANGQLLFKGEIEAEKTLSTSYVADGIYFVKVISENGVSFQKLIISR
jgi:hypothetical protein